MRLRVALRHADRAEAERLAREVTALYTCGPAGGGGVRTALSASASTRCRACVPRDAGARHASRCSTDARPTARTTCRCAALAHGRTGDKGNRSNISVIAWHAGALRRCWSSRSPKRASRAQFAHRRPTRVQRYLLPKLHAMNFVLDDVLDGGVNDALNLDSHGKALSFLLLDLPLGVPRALAPLLRGPTRSV